jgi:arylsulfatase A-like enzyme
MKRAGEKIVIVGIIIFFGIAVGCIPLPAQRAQKPNIILIVIDALRSDHLPAYGYSKNTAPFMTQLASKGVIFDRAYAVAPWTAPSIASIFTSLYPFQHGLTMGLLAQKQLIKKKPELRFHRLPDTIMTLAEMLEKAGYQNLGVTTNQNISSYLGMNQGFHTLEICPRARAEKIYKTFQDISKKMDRKKPYFLYLHFMDVHMPYSIKLTHEEETGDRNRDFIKLYDLELEYLDRNIKELFAANGWQNNTLIIITADHGEEFNEHGKRGHGKSLYREVLQVPFIFYYPSGFPGGRKISENVSNFDIMPTINEILGSPPIKNVSGVSLLPLLQGKKVDFSKRNIYAHLHLKNYGKNDLVIKSVIQGDYHYIYEYPNKRMLFRLSSDPLEQKNIINKEKQIADLLAAQMLDFENKCVTYDKEEKKMKLDPALYEELKSLGYVQ